MNKGIYIAVSGAVLKRRNMDVFAQNIANANTSGYKRERMSFKDHIVNVENVSASNQDGRVMADLSQSVIDYSGGPVSKTGNPLDLAIHGDGFFALEGGKYTRSGRFQLDSEGNLTTGDGIKVLGDGGPIVVQGNSIDISSTGDIIVDDLPVGKLKVVDFPDKGDLKKTGDTMFKSSKEGVTVEAEVSQGYIEGSNVNIIQEMIQMMASNREFESYQKMIHAFDEAASKTINEMGK